MSIYKRVVAAHEYEVRGEKKTSWKEVGIVTQNEKGNMFLSLHALPGIRYNLFDPREDEGKPAKQSGASFDNLKDDIPF